MIMGIQIAVQAIPNFKIKNRDDMKKYLTSMLYSIRTVYLGKENEKIYLLKEFGGLEMIMYDLEVRKVFDKLKEYNK